MKVRSEYSGFLLHPIFIGHFHNLADILFLCISKIEVELLLRDLCIKKLVQIPFFVEDNFNQ